VSNGSAVGPAATDVSWCCAIRFAASCTERFGMGGSVGNTTGVPTVGVTVRVRVVVAVRVAVRVRVSVDVRLAVAVNVFVLVMVRVELCVRVTVPLRVGVAVLVPE